MSTYMAKSDFAESFLFAENQRDNSMRKTPPAIADFEIEER